MITVRVDDLAFAEGDALVWATTEWLRAATPLLRRVETVGGEALARHLQPSEPLAVGSAVVTAAGGLGVELLISAVVQGAEEPVSASGVRRAMASALQRAAAWQIRRLVCAPLGLGAGNLDIDESAAIMVDAIAAHRAQARHPTDVAIVVESAAEAEAFTRHLAGGDG